MSASGHFVPVGEIAQLQCMSTFGRVVAERHQEFMKRIFAEVSFYMQPLSKTFPLDSIIALCIMLFYQASALHYYCCCLCNEHTDTDCIKCRLFVRHIG